MVAPKGSETALKRYASKRDFSVTPEPAPTRTRKPKALSFVVQKHWASRLHYDLRLELDGVLLSWAVPKGPCFDPHEKRMAIHVEDHPVPYGSFEGTIPPKQYGAGTVMVWDNGTWEPVGDPQDGMREGKLVFRLHGQKLAGLWELVRIAKPGDRQEAWILFKKRDEWARPLAEYDVIAALPDSVIDHPLGPLEEREPRVEIRTQALPSPPLVADTLAGAVKAVLPQTLPPQLATRAEDLPSQGRWRYELKLDGYRLLARIDHRGDARLITRQGNDWTDRMESLAADVKSLGLSDTWLDGEIVVLDDKGVPSFNALQNAFDVSRTRSIVYFVFDMPFCEGYDLRQVPWEQRRALLKQLLGPRVGERVRLSEDFDADPRSLLESVRKLGMEGLIAKRVDAPYASRRAETWLKIKLQERQEFVVGGFTERGGGKGEVGSMLLGYYDDQGRLLQAGSVGTGWNAKTGRALFQRLVAIETDVSPFTEGGVQPGRWSRRAAGSERWVKPELVAEVSFAEWTPDGHIRHAIFEGLRDDKPAAEIRREKAASVAPSSARPLVTPRVGSVKVSNPERVIDPSTGLKKLDLVRYYESVAEWMLPH
ncbi:MAG TPA: non-homologous end-joining DNA ligase, partial [Burkholderiaceae bacterium]|nr:non-homologous end-joining DNA ligase [Burkholderiaceae bacterium]